MNTKIYSCFFHAVILSAMLIFAGCQPAAQKQTQKTLSPAGELFTVDFPKDSTVTYSFICDRKIKLNLDPSGKYTKGDKKGSFQEYGEKLELKISYKPIKVDPFGYTVIQAQCLTAKVTKQTQRSSSSAGRKDAVENLQGKQFTLKLTPTGKIVDYSSINALLKELGEDSFSHSRGGSRIKDPDMIMDFAATQWDMWDSIASIEKPLEGLKVNQKWSSKLVVPTPFIKRVARNTEYKLTGFEQLDSSRCAVIDSTYTLADEPVESLPLPYSGSFQMRGTFGFLRGYKVHSIQGSGQQIFDVEKGRIISDRQSYQATVSASIFGLGSGGLEPNIIIDQTLETKLVE